MKNVWPVVHDERRALVTGLESLEEEQWTKQSLCGDWTVHDVVAHLVDTAKTTTPSFLRDMAVARFDFDRQNQRGVERERRETPALMIEALRGVVDLRRSPPAPRDTRLVEAIVHGEDIRRPLGISRTYDTDAVVDAFRLQVRTSESMGGTKKTLSGLTLVATDADLLHGEGPQVAGPALALLLVSAGRAVALDELSGIGVDVLRQRLSG